MCLEIHGGVVLAPAAAAALASGAPRWRHRGACCPSAHVCFRMFFLGCVSVCRLFCFSLSPRFFLIFVWGGRPLARALACVWHRSGAAAVVCHSSYSVSGIQHLAYTDDLILVTQATRDIQRMFFPMAIRGAPRMGLRPCISAQAPACCGQWRICSASFVPWLPGATCHRLGTGFAHASNGLFVGAAASRAQAHKLQNCRCRYRRGARLPKPSMPHTEQRAADITAVTTGEGHTFEKSLTLHLHVPKYAKMRPHSKVSSGAPLQISVGFRWAVGCARPGPLCFRREAVGHALRRSRFVLWPRGLLGSYPRDSGHVGMRVSSVSSAAVLAVYSAECEVLVRNLCANHVSWATQTCVSKASPSVNDSACGGRWEASRRVL